MSETDVRGVAKNVLFAVCDVPLHLIKRKFTLFAVYFVGPVHVDIHNMFGDCLKSSSNTEETQKTSLYNVALFVVRIFDNEDHVKTG